MKVKSFAVFMLLSILAVSAFAQNMSTISYVPVKNGYYDKISTKSTTNLANEIGDVYFETLNANSADLNILARKINFGKPVFVGDSVFLKDNSYAKVSNYIMIDGSAYAAGAVTAQKANGVAGIHARDLIMPLKKLNVAGGSIYVNGVAIPTPGCNLQWIDVNAADSSGAVSSYALLGCAGGGGGSCPGACSPGQTASCGGGNGIKICSSSCSWGTCVCNSGYTWNGTTCSTSGSGSATPNVISTSVLVEQGPSYSMCVPGTESRTQYGIDTSRCSARTNQSACYNDYLVSGDPNIATCTTISMSDCPSTNYQSLCNQNGKGYKCKISASGTPNRVDYCMCDWYGSYCGEASGLSCTYTYLTASGSGSYLSCE